MPPTLGKFGGQRFELPMCISALYLLMVMLNVVLHIAEVRTTDLMLVLLVDS